MCTCPPRSKKSRRSAASQRTTPPLFATAAAAAAVSSAREVAFSTAPPPPATVAEAVPTSPAKRRQTEGMVPVTPLVPSHLCYSSNSTPSSVRQHHDFMSLDFQDPLELIRFEREHSARKNDTLCHQDPSGNQPQRIICSSSSSLSSSSSSLSSPACVCVSKALSFAPSTGFPCASPPLPSSSPPPRAALESVLRHRQH